MTGDVTRYIKLWDAGTEIDEEPALGSATGPRQPAPNHGAADPQPGIQELRGSAPLDVGGPFVLPAVPAMIKVMVSPGPDRTFTLTIQNCSTPSTLQTSQGARPIHLSPFAWAIHLLPAPLFTTGQPSSLGLERIAEDGMPEVAGVELAARTGFHTPLSPGVFVVHRDGTPLFDENQRDRGEGLERIAEDGDPSQFASRATGVFDTPIGAESPGPAMPGEAYAFDLTAAPGDRLSVATMFGMSNDWFFATQGFELFDGDVPAQGDVTAALALYDAGTEVDQRIDIGPATAPQQPAPNTGAADPDAHVREVEPARYPVPTSAHLRLTVTAR